MTTPVKDKVVVAMSGGVDSSVAACMLKDQGFDVIGLFMRVGKETPESCLTDEAAPSRRPHQGCCSATDAQDARFVAGMLDIPFYALNFKGDFDRIIDYFVDEYANGRTPNPCIMCNNYLKFGKIVNYANAVGAKYIATGHYARIGEHEGQRVLMRGIDGFKDQSYVLFGLSPTVLERVLFPVGELNKDEVRDRAAQINLPNRDKPDSVEICFVPDRNYVRLVKEKRPETFLEGDVVNESGEVVGRHKGIGHYTIGQRRGLGIAAGYPIYVTQINRSSNTITVGNRQALYSAGLSANRLNLLIKPPPSPFRARVQIRYLHNAAEATVWIENDDRFRAVFDTPQPAVTPGQAAVIYLDDVVVGGGWIDRAISSDDIG